MTISSDDAKRAKYGAPTASRLDRRVFCASLGSAFALSGCTSATLDPKDLGLSGMSGPTPENYPIHGIDISKYQGDVDWERAQKGGVAFAFLKATEGGDRIDGNFETNWRNAGSAGIPRGAYHFFYHCRSGAEQARWFIANVPRTADALPPVLDVEWTPDSPTCTLRPPRSVLVREMSDFLDAIEKHYGVRPLIYTPIDVHRERLVGTFPRHEFWLRAVKDHPNNVYSGRSFRFWQWTATGSVPGVTGEVDRNAFGGTRGDWAKWVAATRPRYS